MTDSERKDDCGRRLKSDGSSESGTVVSDGAPIFHVKQCPKSAELESEVAGQVKLKHYYSRFARC